MASKKCKYIITGYYGADSFGDELILHCILRNYGNQCVVISKDPAKTEKLHKVESIGKKSIFKIIKKLIKSEGLLIGGGGLFLPSNTKSYIYYLLLVYVAKLLDKRVIIERISIQENSLKNKLNRLLMLLLTKSANKFSVRDIISFREIISNIGMGNKILIEKDFVEEFLEKNLSNVKKNYKRKARNQIGVVLMHSENVDYDKVAEFLFKYYNLEKRFYIFNMSDRDYEFVKEFIKKYNLKQCSIINFSPANFESIEDMLNNIIYELLQNKLFISMRFHPLVLSYKLGVPSVAIAHNSKIKAYCQKEGINVLF